jgi:hypothetical protein
MTAIPCSACSRPIPEQYEPALKAGRPYHPGCLRKLEGRPPR